MIFKIVIFLLFLF